MKTNFKKNDGFTLVELIVVIAILAILAAVAIPAYSGYIEKANTAADEQLLAAINKAYASACLENGKDMAMLAAESGAVMPLTDNKTVDVDNVAPYGEEFKLYFAGNENSAFQVFSSIVYSPSLGMFCNSTTAPDMLVGGYMVDGDVLAAFQSGAMGALSTEELITMVTDLTGVLGGEIGKQALPLALASDSYQKAALALLGVSGKGYNEYMQEKKDAAYTQYLKDYQAEHPDVDPYGRGEEAQAARDAATAAANKQVADMEKNMLVLVGASKAEDAGAGLVDLLKSGNAYTTINNNVKGIDGGDAALGTAQSALAYALYASYATSNNITPDPSKFANAMKGNDAGFIEYINGDTVENDLAGIQGVMGMISEQDPAKLEQNAMNGLDNQELAAVLQQILGK